jgi:hypothetical protein
LIADASRILNPGKAYMRREKSGGDFLKISEIFIVPFANSMMKRGDSPVNVNMGKPWISDAGR